MFRHLKNYNRSCTQTTNKAYLEVQNGDKKEVNKVLQIMFSSLNGFSKELIETEAKLGYV